MEGNLGKSQPSEYYGHIDYDAKIMLAEGPYPIGIATREEANVEIWLVLTEGVHIYNNWLYCFAEKKAEDASLSV